uniref:Putative secreted protein n=1 Tax=Rhipicephalus microplus TaxID=6941 RepID=A0A6M2DEU1_RHIMP
MLKVKVCLRVLGCLWSLYQYCRGMSASARTPYSLIIQGSDLAFIYASLCSNVSVYAKKKSYADNIPQ